MNRKAAQRLISDAASASQASPEERWQAAFGCDAPIRPSEFLEAALAWHVQVLVHGEVAPAIADKLHEAAASVRASRVNCAGAAPEQVHAPRAKPAVAAAAAATTAHSVPSELAPGTRLVKIHGGHTHVVEVTMAGMLYQDQLYSSLSAVAKAITGTHWNGLLFFGLRKRKTYHKVADA